MPCSSKNHLEIYSLCAISLSNIIHLLESCTDVSRNDSLCFTPGLTFVLIKSQAKSLSVLRVSELAGTQTASRTLPNWKRNVTSGPSMITGTLPTPLPTLAALLPLEVLWLRCARIAMVRKSPRSRSSCPVLPSNSIKFLFSASLAVISRGFLPSAPSLVIANAKDERKFNAACSCHRYPYTALAAFSFDCGSESVLRFKDCSRSRLYVSR